MNYQLLETPPNAARPGGVRMYVRAGFAAPLAGNGFVSLIAAKARGLKGRPLRLLVGDSVNSGPLISLSCEYGDFCLFLSVPRALGYLMGHFKSQVMCFRAT